MGKLKRAKSKPPKFQKCHCIERTVKGYCNSVQKCPHIHFKSDVPDREELGRNEYLNLLCTPKGYRWPPFTGVEEGEEDEENVGAGKRVICQGQKVRKADRAYVHNFLAEVWALLTPEMVNRLKEMLQTEFKMSPEEATEFILEQKAKSIPVVEEPLKKEPPKKVKGLVLRRGRKCTGIRHYYSSQFNRIVSAKVTDYLVATLSSRRTKNQRKISEFLLRNLTDLTGEKFTLQYPKTLAQKIMVFLTDRVSGWLADRVTEAEELLREDKEIENLKAEKKRQEKEKEKREKEKAKKEDKPSDKKGDTKSKSTKPNKPPGSKSSKPQESKTLVKEDEGKKIEEEEGEAVPVPAKKEEEQRKEDEEI